MEGQLQELAHQAGEVWNRRDVVRTGDTGQVKLADEARIVNMTLVDGLEHFSFSHIFEIIIPTD